MPEQVNLTEVHSEEVQDIIGRTPVWVVRSGTTVVACVLLLILIGAWFIKYPDMVSATTTLSAAAPPVKIVAQANGRITQFYAKDKDSIGENAIIAVIDNPANTKDMLYLKDLVERLDTTLNLQNAISSITMPKNIQVGDVQADYAALFQAINNYNFFFSSGYYANKVDVIKNQGEGTDKIKKLIESRDKMLRDQLKLDQWKDSINQLLVKEKVISLAEYNEIRKGYLSQQMTSQDNISSMIQNEQQRREYQKSISDIQQQYRTEEKDVLLAVSNAVKRIKSQVASWEKQYVLRAPLAGQLAFFKVWQVNQYVRSGEPLFMVSPGVQQYTIRAQLPIYKAGKIKEGQRALIKLHEYPYAEFGMLQAEVVSVTNVALDSAYTVQLKLQNGLRTTRNQVIIARPEITGTADIITNDKSILDRVFESMYGKMYEK